LLLCPTANPENNFCVFILPHFSQTCLFLPPLFSKNSILWPHLLHWYSNIGIVISPFTPQKELAQSTLFSSTALNPYCSCRAESNTEDSKLQRRWGWCLRLSRHTIPPRNAEASKKMNSWLFASYSLAPFWLSSSSIRFLIPSKLSSRYSACPFRASISCWADKPGAKGAPP
jgi:hypothetical protein